MRTKKQAELVESYLSILSDELKPLYRDIALYLSGLGYNPYKERSYLTFKHDSHNKQMAKMGTRRGKAGIPFFALRFSACRGYSRRFADIVRSNIERHPTRAGNCMGGGCGYCRGEPDTHVYTYEFPGGEAKSHCGAIALEIPDITVYDMEEIKQLIAQEHEYLMEHEAN